MATFIEMLLDEVIYDHSRRDFIQNARKYYLKIWFISFTHMYVIFAAVITLGIYMCCDAIYMYSVHTCTMCCDLHVLWRDLRIQKYCNIKGVSK